MIRPRLLALILTLSLTQACRAAEPQSSFVFGDSAAVVDVGIEVAPDVTAGLRGMFGYAKDGGVSETHLKVDSKFAGLFLHYPVLSITSEKLPVEGVVYGGASLMYSFQGDGDVFFIPEIGVDTVISDRVSARVSYLYNKRDAMFADESEILLGVKVSF